MATKIDDLPQGNITQELPDTNLQKIDNSNIKADIKKKVTFEEPLKESFLSKIQSEISEENVLLIIIIILAAMPSLNIYITKLPIIGVYATSDLFTAIIKGILLFIVYIVCKYIVIPRIKL